jgi:hypothetical protein
LTGGPGRLNYQRLRALLDDFKEQLATNRRDVDLQFTRLSQLQAEIDILKASNGRSHSR